MNEKKLKNILFVKFYVTLPKNVLNICGKILTFMQYYPFYDKKNYFIFFHFEDDQKTMLKN